MKTIDAKTEVTKQLLELARVIRRRGTPEEAEAALPYERQLARDLAARQTELAQREQLELAHA